MLYWEQVSPSHVGKGGFAPIMRLAGVLGVGAGFLLFYQRSLRTFISTYVWIVSGKIKTFFVHPAERGICVIPEILCLGKADCCMEEQ